MTRTLINIATLLGLLSIYSCRAVIETGSDETDGLQAIHALHQNYRTYWLQNDSTKVVNLFHEHGSLIPPNNSGDFVRGRTAIGQWWFSATGDTSYPITGFVYREDSLIVVDSKTAIWQGVSTVRWDTVVRGSRVSSAESSSNFMTICSKEDGEWKILRQIWNAKPQK